VLNRLDSLLKEIRASAIAAITVAAMDGGQAEAEKGHGKQGRKEQPQPNRVGQASLMWSGGTAMGIPSHLPGGGK